MTPGSLPLRSVEPRLLPDRLRLGGSGLVTALGVLALFSGCGRGAPANLGKEDVGAIMDGERALQEAILDGSWETAAGLYAERADLAAPHTGELDGRGDIAAFLERRFAPATSFELRPVDVGGRGDLAYVHGRWSMTTRAPAAPGDTVTLRDGGSYLEIRRRAPDGRWLIVKHVLHSVAPRPAPGRSDSGS